MIFGKKETFNGKPKTEADELEESIKKLGLFKELEKKERGQLNEKQSIFGKLFRKEPNGVKTTGKITETSTKLDKFHKIFHEAEEAARKNNISEAKRLYMDARNLYVNLTNSEKRDVYDELMELYNKLAK